MICIKCKADKEINEFYKSNLAASKYICIPCAKILAKNWKKNNPERARDWSRINMRKWRSENKEKAIEQQRVWREENPEKVRAYRVTRMRKNGDSVLKSARLWKSQNKHKTKAEITAWKALQAGKIERKPCEVCGATGEMHHDDYSKPFDVRWLCPRHHRRLHSSLNRRRTSCQGKRNDQASTASFAT